MLPPSFPTGINSRFNIFRSVDFPPPVGPHTHKKSPRSRLKLTPVSTSFMTLTEYAKLRSSTLSISISISPQARL